MTEITHRKEATPTADSGQVFSGPGGIAGTIDAGLFEEERRAQEKAEQLDAVLREMSMTQVLMKKEVLAKRFGLKPREIIQCYKDLQANVADATRDMDEEKLAELDPMALDPEPWEDDVELYGLIEEVRKLLHAHVVFKDGYQETACALWIVATWFVDQFDYAPYLMVTSPLKRCGKSTLMTLIERLVYRPASGALMSASAVYRMLESRQRTLIIDEADNFVRADPQFLGVLLCGIERDGSTTHVWKCDKDVSGAFTSRPYQSFAFKAIAGIKAEYILPTLTDRAIVIKLRRRTKNDNPTLGKKELERSRFADIRRKLFKASIQWADRVRDARPVAGVTDREEEKWLPLLKVADAVADPANPNSRASSLSKYARKCAEVLLFNEMETTSMSAEELLRCLLSVHLAYPYETNVHTKTLLERLTSEPDWEWKNANHGRGLSPRGLSEMLASFDVRCRQVKADNVNRNGYVWADIEKAGVLYGIRPYGHDETEERAM